MSMSPRLLRPMASGFNPKSVSGLYLWLDGANSSSVTLNGGNVSQWRDLSGANRHFSQSTSGAQPVYTTAGQNGKNCLTFDASRRLVSDSESSAWSFLHDGSALYDIYLVWRTAAASTALRSILATGSSGGGIRQFYLWHDHRSGNNNQFYAAVTQTGGQVADSFINGLVPDTIRVARVSGDPANATSTARLAMRVAATSGSSNSYAASAQSGDPSSTLIIGSLTTSGLFQFSGAICEILIYSGSEALTATQRSSIQAHLTTKWGVL